nr:hypothetical protein [Tanacetum cinerariifolium]
MAPLTFADTHNMVAFLSKSDASDGFDQIVDFLNAHTIKYDLMVNPTIYVSCIKQFWATATMEKVNGDIQLQSLIDDKKVVVTKDIVRRDLHLDDADGVECLPHAEIFEELARMGYEKAPPKLAFYKAFFFAQWKFLIHTIVQCISAKRTTWNEFSSSILSAVICLATGRKFNLSKYIFDSMVRNVDSPTKEESKEAKQEKEVKDFRVKKDEKAINVDKGTTLVNAETDEEEVALDAESQGRTNLNAASKGVSIVIAPKLVSTAEPTVFDNEDLHDEEVQKAAARDEHERADMEKALELQKELDEREDDIDWSAIAEQVKQRQSNSIKRYQDLKKKHVSVAQARKNMMIYLKNMAGYKMEFFKGMTYEEIRPIFEREYNKIQTLFKKDKDVQETKKKKVADETLLQESFKKLRAAEVSGSESTQEIPTNDPKEITEEDVQNMLEIVPVPKFRLKLYRVKSSSDTFLGAEEDASKQGEIAAIDADEVKERQSDSIKRYQDLKKKPVSVAQARNNMMIYLRNTAGYKMEFFKGMTYDEIKPIFQRDECGVHNVSSTRGHDIYMLIENDYLLSNAVMILMLRGKLQVEEDNETTRDLVRNIFMEANRPRNMFEYILIVNKMLKLKKLDD